jgi:hypothetical protein
MSYSTGNEIFPSNSHPDVVDIYTTTETQITGSAEDFLQFDFGTEA